EHSATCAAWSAVAVPPGAYCPATDHISVTSGLQVGPYHSRTGVEDPGLGHLSPAALGNGKTVKALTLWQIINGTNFVYLRISGFSADPGSTWLTYLQRGTSILNGSSANYSYSGGTAAWQWMNSSIPLPVGTSVTVTISHQ